MKTLYVEDLEENENGRPVVYCPVYDGGGYMDIDNWDGSFRQSKTAIEEELELNGRYDTEDVEKIHLNEHGFFTDTDEDGDEYVDAINSDAYERKIATAYWDQTKKEVAWVYYTPDAYEE